MTNSRAKGAREERGAASEIREYGFQARRGQQFRGGSDSPDVITDLPIHLEVKAREQMSHSQIYEWLDQCRDESEGRMPVLITKRNRCDRLATVRLGDFLKLWQYADVEALRRDLALTELAQIDSEIL